MGPAISSVTPTRQGLTLTNAHRHLPKTPRPKEFHINGATPEDRAAREARAAERAARAADAAAAPYHPAPGRGRQSLSAALPRAGAAAPTLEVGDTLAMRLKREATRRALEEGRFECEEAR